MDVAPDPITILLESVFDMDADVPMTIQFVVVVPHVAPLPKAIGEVPGACAFVPMAMELVPVASGLLPMDMAAVFDATADLPTAIASTPTEQAAPFPTEIPFVDAVATAAEVPSATAPVAAFVLALDPTTTLVPAEDEEPVPSTIELPPLQFPRIAMQLACVACAAVPSDTAPLPLQFALCPTAMQFADVAVDPDPSASTLSALHDPKMVTPDVHDACAEELTPMATDDDAAALAADPIATVDVPVACAFTP